MYTKIRNKKILNANKIIEIQKTVVAAKAPVQWPKR
jgi:hypothetical protein